VVAVMVDCASRLTRQGNSDNIGTHLSSGVLEHLSIDGSVL
jgi:hypothetical protein